MGTKKILSLLKNYKLNSEYKNVIKELGLFGSYATGKAKNGSDIDIFLRLYPVRMFDLIGIKEDFEKLMRKKVDIVILRKSMNKYLKKQIEEKGIYV